MSSTAVLLSTVYIALTFSPISQVSVSSLNLDVGAGRTVQIPETTKKRNLAFDCATARAIPLQKYGGSDPHGPDPHGDDPHDEQHDKGLPANRDRNEGRAPKDVYGDQYPNNQAPY